jgi:hypothetical protein
LQTATIILARWKNHFSQLFNIHVHDITQTEIHTTELPETSTFEVELATEKLKSTKSPGIDQTPAELITAGGEQFAEMHTLY